MVQKKSYDFAIRIVGLYRYLTLSKKEFVLSKQVLRSGTSIGANTEEAEGGCSKNDFSHKISIAYKESRETKYWLRLLRDTGYLKESFFVSIFSDCEDICRILARIIISTRAKD